MTKPKKVVKCGCKHSKRDHSERGFTGWCWWCSCLKFVPPKKKV